MRAGRARTGARATRAAGAVLASLAAATAAAQQPSPSPSPPRFEGAARLVTVDVVVTDAAGRPVRDLAAGDFRVFEEGQPRPVARFDPPPSGAALEHARGEPLPGGVEPGSASLLLLLDDEHLTPSEAREAVPLLEHLLCRALGKDDRATLVVASSGEWRTATGGGACTDLGPRMRAVRGRLLDPHDDELSGPG